MMRLVEHIIQCTSQPGHIYTQGEDIEDAMNNLKEAAELHIEEIGIESLELRQVERRELEIVV